MNDSKTIASGGSNGLSRRHFLKAGGAGLLAMQVLPGGTIMGTAWASEPTALKPESFKTLVQMSRDTYPHDALEDKYYATAVEILDKAGKEDAEALAMLEKGVADLDATAGAGGYAGLADEAARVKMLESMSADPFFQKVRGNLVVGLYNQKELWAAWGYEGEVASRGGYIENGFDDITWLT
ncbi:MAG: gluconate 2-dehydrogenase subunit 3 family protein [Rhizobiaceae bacterium]|nr:gluconate 2-dehydrogenase subunit 3 family protein [Rhizobiaceae bacterium]